MKNYHACDAIIRESRGQYRYGDVDISFTKEFQSVSVVCGGCSGNVTCQNDEVSKNNVRRFDFGWNISVTSKSVGTTLIQNSRFAACPISLPQQGRTLFLRIFSNGIRIHKYRTIRPWTDMDKNASNTGTTDNNWCRRGSVTDKRSARWPVSPIFVGGVSKNGLSHQH